VSLDADTIDVLRSHRVAQNAERLASGEAWTDTGRVFVKEDGTAYLPDGVSQRFLRAAKNLGLPRIRLHDLRHNFGVDRARVG
jgi:integrase